MRMHNIRKWRGSDVNGERVNISIINTKLELYLLCCTKYISRMYAAYRLGVILAGLILM